MARFRAEYARVEALKAEDSGTLTVHGIDRIPLDTVKVKKREMAEMFVIFEGGSRAMPTNDLTSYYGTEHVDAVSAIACHSYIEVCTNSFGTDVSFQVYLDVYTLDEIEKPGAARYIKHLISYLPILQQLEQFPDSLKIVSISEIGSTPASFFGTKFPFAAVESAGNIKRDSYYPPRGFCNSGKECDFDFVTDPGTIGFRAAIAADKVLIVVGYDFLEAEKGNYVNAGTGCIGEGISEGCIWTPITFFLPEPREGSSAEYYRNSVCGASVLSL